MIRIIHLSDFHLNDDNLFDWDTYIKSELINTIKSFADSTEPCFIVCTGDLIDKGGKGNIETAFNTFKEEVIEPILSETGLTKDHFILTPGNHDINRNADQVYEDSGLKAEFEKQGVKFLNAHTKKIIETDDKGGSQRMRAYSDFIKDFYSDCSNVKTTYLGTSFVFEENDIRIGFSSLNTAWCCYDDNDNKQGVYIGEPQYHKCLNEVSECDVKIAIMHHPIDWLKLERNSIAQWIYKDYNLFLCGHVHETETTLTTNLYNMLFVDIAPSFTNEIRSKSNSFANGFSIINYDSDKKLVEVYFYKYKLDERKYILNTDYVSDGVLSFPIFDRTTNNVDSIIYHSSDYIKKNHYPEFDSMLIPQKANVITSLLDAFVMPPITKHASETQKQITLSDLILNKSNVLILGGYESGKSVLLYRLVVEMNDNIAQYGKIPVYIDFNEIRNRELESIIKEYLDLQSHAVNTLLNANMIQLLIDNYNPIEEGKHIANKIYNFIKKHDVSCIATFATDIYDIPKPLRDNNEIAFEYYFLHHFRTENIRDLMIKWNPDQEFLHRNERISKMVNSFCSYSLPCTAMSVSLYLWSTENEKKEPVNQAVLLEIYIEIILEKLSTENIYQNTFDYDNKVMLLSYIAYRMRSDMECFLEENKGSVLDYSYSIGYDQYISFISDYLKILGWEERFDAEKLGQEFVKLKIFRKSVNTISFSHSCFYYYFLAKRMINFPDYKEHIINSDAYYKNDRIIDYYGGLSRSDEALLQFLVQKFEDYFSPVQIVYDSIDVDKCFTDIIEGAEPYSPRVESQEITNFVIDKPSDERIEKKLIKASDEKLSRITDDFNRNQILSPDKLIVMLGKALRNLDGVENIELRQKAYNLLIKNSIIFTVIVKETLASYANSHSGELPPSLSRVNNVEFFFRFMPVALQMSLNEIMGTTKLESIFEKKLKSDFSNKCSDVEKYFSLAMLWDSTGCKHEKEMKDMIKMVKRNSVRDYLYFKIRHYYDYKVTPGSPEEDVCLELLLRLTRRGRKLRYLSDTQIKKRIKNAKNARTDR